VVGCERRRRDPASSAPHQQPTSRNNGDCHDYEECVLWHPRSLFPVQYTGVRQSVNSELCNKLSPAAQGMADTRFAADQAAMAKDLENAPPSDGRRVRVLPDGAHEFADRGEGILGDGPQNQALQIRGSREVLCGVLRFARATGGSGGGKGVNNRYLGRCGGFFFCPAA